MREKQFALEKWADHSNIARVISETKSSYLLGLADGQVLTGRKKYGAPAYFVGDVVRLQEKNQHVWIDSLVERKKVISKLANQTLKDDHEKVKEQILATNVDKLFILIAVDQNFSIAKVERFVLIFQQKAVELTVLLTKKDLKPDVDKDLAHLRELYPQVEFLAISLYDEVSLRVFKSHLKAGKIGLLIGASGAGKSSLLNHLLGMEQVKINQVRKDRKGKHTTTSSFLHECLDLDYCMIDTPGFKGIDSQHEVDASSLFEDIVALSRECKFSNCQHETEPACAVKAALVSGRLSQEKWERYCYQAEKIATFSKNGLRK